MFQLLGLTKFILVPIIASWLPVESLMLLDTAYCNRKNRVDLIDLIRAYARQFMVCEHEDEHVVLVNGMMEWLQCRELDKTLTKIIMRKSVDAGNCLSSVSDRLCSIRMENIAEDVKLLGLVHSFVNLDSFSCSRIQESLINALFTAMAECCHLIRSIETSQCKYLNPESVLQLCHSNPMLVSLRTDVEVSWCPTLSCLIVNCRQLKVIVWEICSARLCAMLALHCSPSLVCLSDGNFTDLLLMAYRGAHLSTLTILDTARPELDLNDLCPRLTHLTIIKMSVSREVLLHLPAGCRVLHLLGAVLNTDDLQLIGEVCPSLECLTVNGATTSSSCFEKLPGLLSLCILWTESYSPVLTSIATHCKSLTMLELMEFVDASKLASVLQNCLHLTHLNVEMGSPLICDIVAEHGGRLKTFLLRGLLKQTVNGMIKVLKNCSKLRTLHCTDSAAVKNLLPHIAHHCSRLTELSVVCSSFPVCTLAEYVSQMPRLSVLIASLNDEEVEEIKRRRRDICILQQFV